MKTISVFVYLYVVCINVEQKIIFWHVWQLWWRRKDGTWYKLWQTFRLTASTIRVCLVSSSSAVVHSESTKPITFQFNNLLNNVLNFNSRGRKMKYCLVWSGYSLLHSDDTQCQPLHWALSSLQSRQAAALCAQRDCDGTSLQNHSMFVIIKPLNSAKTSTF